MVILFWLFFIFIVVGGLFYIFMVIYGVGTIIRAKIKGVSLQEQYLSRSSPDLWQYPEMSVTQQSTETEKAEEREAREKVEARKRYLESLVDRDHARRIRDIPVSSKVVSQSPIEPE